MGNYHFITIEEKTEGPMPNMGTVWEKLSFAINISPMEYLAKAKKSGRKIALLHQQTITQKEFNLFQ